MESSFFLRYSLVVLAVLCTSNFVSSYIPFPDCSNDHLVVNVSFKPQPGHCTWHGQCVKNLGSGGGMFNCYYNGPALSAYKNKELMSLLNQTCPWYIKGKEGEDTKVCCDVAQLKTLKVQTEQARSLFSRCPACIDNFMKHYCFTTCDPDMSLYIEPRLQPKMDNKISVHQCTLKNGSNVTYLQSVNVTVDTDYANKLYNSCSNVQYPEKSIKVISLMCGDADKCSYSKWLSFLGDPGQDYNQAPFLMEYQYSENHDPKMTPFTTNLTKCNDKGPLQCNCLDCPRPKVCPPPPLQFYRTKQIIIAPNPNIQPYNMTMKGIYSPVTFGPVFNHDVLMEVYHLQNALTNIVVNRSDGSPIHLSDICFKPLYPNNSNCMIESVINYFQNNLTRLNYSEVNDFGIEIANASSHIHYCTRDPMAIRDPYIVYQAGQFPCLADYGEMVNPTIALVGFPVSDESANYDMSAAITITFAFKDDVDEQKNKDAMLWEVELIKYLKAYKGRNIMVVFSPLYNFDANSLHRRQK